MQDEVTDVVEDVVEVAKKNGLIIPVALGLLVVGAGVGIGYLIGQRRKYEVIKLGDRMPQAPPRVIVNESDLEELGKEIAEDVIEELIIEQGYTEPVAVVTVDGAVPSNIFAHSENTDVWDYDEEIAKRTDLAPYTIHSDEYFADDPDTDGLIHGQLTYYAGDEVLTETINGAIKPIHNHKSMVGELRFGHGSDDPNVVYVRNLTRNTQWEIIRDPGHYRIEVLGLQMEEEASLLEKKEERARQRRMRQE